MKQVQILLTLEIDSCDDAAMLLPVTYVQFIGAGELRGWADQETDIEAHVPGEDGPSRPPLARILSSEVYHA
tara:strand:- start:287 stop:502 length:216 start_codon:yes stop_codon:yes gene_type:complete